MMKKKAFMALCMSLFVSLAVLTGCQSKEESTPTVNKEPYSEQQFLMGTYVRVSIYDNDKEDVLKAAFDRVKFLAKEITVNDPNETNSQIEEINKQSGIKPVKISDDMFTLVKSALEYTKSSQGGFDLTIGPITDLWRIGFDDARKPSQTEIDDALKLVNYQDVVLNEKEHTVFLKQKGMQLDLGAIAKGYITDEVVEVLKEHDVTTAIVDLGGNIYVLGHSPRQKNGEWKVGVQDPDKERNQVVGTLSASNQSLVTSGIYERYLEVDGVKYHHLFDARTGYPFDNELAGVSIVSEKSIDGDGLSTAVFSMGLEKGLAFVETRKDIDAIFITKDHKVYISSGLKDNFKLNTETDYTLERLEGK